MDYQKKKNRNRRGEIAPPSIFWFKKRKWGKKGLKGGFWKKITSPAQVFYKDWGVVMVSQAKNRNGKKFFYKKHPREIYPFLKKVLEKSKTN